MSTYEWLLIGHLLGVFVLVMAGGISAGTGFAATRATSGLAVVTLLDLQRKSDLYAFSIGGVAAIVFGTLLVNETNYGYGDAWISASYTIVIAMFAVVHAIMAPRAKRAREYAAGLGNGLVDETLKTKLNDPLLNAGGLALTVALVVLVWLMVAKPGA